MSPPVLVRQLEADRPRADVDRRVELEAARAPLGHDRRVVAGEGRRVDPGADRHAAGELQAVGLPRLTLSSTPSRATRVAVLAAGPAGAVGQGAGDAVAGRVGRGRAGAASNAYPATQPGRRRWRGVVDGDGARARRRRVAGGVTSAGGEQVGAVRRRGRVPRGRVRRGRVLGAERRAVEQELHADDADVVGRRWRRPPPSPTTVAAGAGAPMSTVGAVVSGAGVVAGAGVDGPERLPAASRARTV